MRRARGRIRRRCSRSTSTISRARCATPSSATTCGRSTVSSPSVESGFQMIWANSGDSHVLEPPGLWAERMRADLAARMPRTEEVDDRHEMLYVDGRSFKRRLQWNPEVTEEELIRAGQVARGREPGMRALDLFRPPGA